jgi:hypothetical protein
MDYYNRSDSVLFVPACLLILILACAAAAWLPSINAPSIPQVIKHIIVLPNSGGMV